eukprot:gene28871-34845_t
MKSCVICGKIKSSYKCPKCLSPYCSKDCCGAHKTLCEQTKAHESSNNLSTTLGVDEGRELIEAIDEAIAQCRPDDRAQNASEDVPSSSNKVSTNNYAHTENVTLTDEQKDRLINNSEILKSLLKSKRLRDDIAFVDNSSDRLAALRNMRSKNAEFNGVMEKILDILYEGKKA